MYWTIFFQDYQKEIGENRLQIEYINNRKHTVYDNIEEEVIMSAIENEGMCSDSGEKPDQGSF